MKSSRFGQGLNPFRLQNSPYFCLFKYARAVKQKVWNETDLRIARLARVRHLGHALPISLPILRKKKTDCFAVYNPLSPKSNQ